jgi:hypothetical protein
MLFYADLCADLPLENLSLGFWRDLLGFRLPIFSKTFPRGYCSPYSRERICWRSGISLGFQSFIVLLADGSRLPESLIFDRSLMESKLIDGLAAFYLKQEGLVP